MSCSTPATRYAQLHAEAKRTKRHKYHAVKTTVDGITFDSKAEARRYQELKMLEKAGQIVSLECQPIYALHVCGVHLGDYRADFRYIPRSTHPDFAYKRVTEDVKGCDTPMSRWKRKHVKAQYGIDVQIVK